ncbi:helix-turn-helix transcriptional regulator [Caldithrix abyssi]|nr:helix-turn-helix transcriptional regulator [Caldithrix abyssi]
MKQNERSCIRSYVDNDKIEALQRDLINQDQLYEHANTFALMGDLTRLKILYCLSKTAELCVCDLSDVLGMKVSAISHQLRKLRDRNLVTNRRDGLTIYYSNTQSAEAKAACTFFERLFTPIGSNQWSSVAG